MLNFRQKALHRNIYDTETEEHIVKSFIGRRFFQQLVDIRDGLRAVTLRQDGYLEDMEWLELNTPRPIELWPGDMRVFMEAMPIATWEALEEAVERVR